MRFTLACAFALSVAGCGGSGLQTGTGDSPDMAQVAAPGPDLAMQATPGPDLAIIEFEDMAAPVETPDLAQPPEPPADAGIQCGNQTCPLGQKCCATFGNGMASATCMDSCGDGALTIACDGPEQCGGNPCCVDVQNAMFNGGAMCTAAPTDCAPTFDIQKRSGMDRLCHNDNDCTSGAANSQAPNCCTITQGGASVHTCLNKNFVGLLGFAGIKATCP